MRNILVNAKKSVFLMIPSFLLMALTPWCEASAQSVDKEPEAVAIVEVGGAAARSLGGGGASAGGTAAIEVTPIEKWLELEAGVTSLFSRHSRETDVDLLFKKPWTLSKKVEFMFGVGPEWVHTRESGTTRNSIAGEAVLDFMFWPSVKRRLGWYLEPGYVSLGVMRSQSASRSGC